jgi:hypothetical protein
MGRPPDSDLLLSKGLSALFLSNGLFLPLPAGHMHKVALGLLARVSYCIDMRD